MNHQSDNDDDSSDSPPTNKHRPSTADSRPTTSSPSKPIVRKLPDSRKLPFQAQTRDESKPCSSGRLFTSAKKSPTLTVPSTSSCGYAFNFNAIKSRFAEPNEPLKTKKRQFEGLKNDLGPTETQGPKADGQATFLPGTNASSGQAIDTETPRQLADNRLNLMQSESKRQKSHDVNDEECSSVIDSKDSTPPGDLIEPSAAPVDKLISVVNTTEHEAVLHSSQMPDQVATTDQSSRVSNNGVLPEEAPFVTRIQVNTPSEAATSTSATMSSDSREASDIRPNSNLEINKKSTDNAEPHADTDEDDVDLSDIGLSSEFVRQREEEKAKAEAQKLAAPLTDPRQASYWERVFDTELYRSRSLTFSDLMNLELGYAGRMGHGNRNNFFRPHALPRPPRRLIYDQQLQSARQYIDKAQNNLGFVRRMAQSHRLVEHDGCVNALNFNKTGTLLLSGSDDYRVCIWDWSRSSVVLQYESGHKSNVFQTKFVPFSGDTQIVTCARDGQVRLALISSDGTHIGTKRLAKHADSCHKLSMEYDSSNLFLSCGEDGVVFEVDLRQSQPAKILTVKSQTRGYRLPLYSVHSNPSDTYQFCVAGRDPFIRIYDKRMLVADKSKMVKKFCPSHLADSQRSSITSAVYNHDGTEIIASYSDEDIYLYKTSQQEGEEATHQYGGHRNSDTVKGVNYYGANSDYIISGSDCGRVFFWEKSSQQIVQVLKNDDAESSSSIVNVLEPHPSFPYLATSGLDSDVKIWSPSAPEPNKLENLAEIIRQNKMVRETSRHFSLSSFEFELLLLLMHRPNSRVLVGSTNNDELTGRLSAAGVSRMSNESVDGADLFGSYSLRRRRGLLPTTISNAFADLDEDEVREFSPVDDEDDEEQSPDEEDDEEDDAFMDFDEEE